MLCCGEPKAAPGRATSPVAAAAACVRASPPLLHSQGVRVSGLGESPIASPYPPSDPALTPRAGWRHREGRRVATQPRARLADGGALRAGTALGPAAAPRQPRVVLLVLCQPRCRRSRDHDGGRSACRANGGGGLEVFGRGADARADAAGAVPVPVLRLRVLRVAASVVGGRPRRHVRVVVVVLGVMVVAGASAVACAGEGRGWQGARSTASCRVLEEMQAGEHSQGKVWPGGGEQRGKPQGK